MEQAKQILTGHKSLVLQVVVIVAILAVAWFVIIPQAKAYIETSEKITTLSNQAEQLEKKVTELSNVDEAETEKNLEVVFTVLPKEQDVPQAVIALQNLTVQSGLGLTSISYASGVKGTISNSYKLNAEVVGNITSVNDLIQRLKDSPRIFQIESVEVEGSAEGGDLDGKIPFLSFYKPPPSTAISPDQPLTLIDNKDKELLSRLSDTLAQSSLATTSAFEDPSTIPLGKENPFE